MHADLDIEVRVMRENVAALGFWRAAIDAHARGRFEEATRDDERWHGTVFVVPAA
jgi:hypothetical protein